jgi:hypothetical protein
MISQRVLPPRAPMRLRYSTSTSLIAWPTCNEAIAASSAGLAARADLAQQRDLIGRLHHAHFLEDVGGIDTGEPWQSDIAQPREDTRIVEADPPCPGPGRDQRALDGHTAARLPACWRTRRRARAGTGRAPRDAHPCAPGYGCKEWRRARPLRPARPLAAARSSGAGAVKISMFGIQVGR